MLYETRQDGANQIIVFRYKTKSCVWQWRLIYNYVPLEIRWWFFVLRTVTSARWIHLKLLKMVKRHSMVRDVIHPHVEKVLGRLARTVDSGQKSRPPVLLACKLVGSC